MIMGAFYGNKIKNKEIRKKTGKAWTSEDVPIRWKAETEQWLKNN